MLIEIILFIAVGIILGTLVGLTPGIHVNLVGVILVSLSITILSGINPIYLVVFVTSMAITQTFVDFIPSVFLGCPDTDTELSILPGHELLKDGRGHEAVTLTAYGGLVSLFALIIIVIPLSLLILKIYPIIQEYMSFILIAAFLLLVMIEKNKATATIVFILSGVLGWSVLNLESLKEPLLPLLTGLFGSSALIISIRNKTQILEQEITKPKIKFIKPLIGSLIASPICGFLPGLGSGQAAIIGNSISKTDKKGFLFLLGATNTLVMSFSFISLYLISKTRTGAAVAINEIIGIPSKQILILIFLVIIISGIISFFLTIKFSEIFAKNITKIKYNKLSLIVLVLITIITFIVSGTLGLLVLIISTFAGIFFIDSGVRRTNMMGCLLIPTIIYYLF